jgi:hypothetical protein
MRFAFDPQQLVTFLVFPITQGGSDLFPKRTSHGPSPPTPGPGFGVTRVSRLVNFYSGDAGAALRFFLNVRFFGAFYIDGETFGWRRRMKTALHLIGKHLRAGQTVLLHCKAYIGPRIVFLDFPKFSGKMPRRALRTRGRTSFEVPEKGHTHPGPM